jgi:hypothetical protein
MRFEPMAPEQVDALGRMNKKIHDEYRNLGFAGINLDTVRYLAFRQQTHNDKFTELIVSDAGVFFIDLARRIKFKFDSRYFFVYHDGLHQVEEEKIRNSGGPVIVLDNLLEFWNRQGTGLCLIADHLNHCDYLFPEQKTELKRVQLLYSKDEFVINPMLQRKLKGISQKPSVGVFDLED